MTISHTPHISTPIRVYPDGAGCHPRYNTSDIKPKAAALPICPTAGHAAWRRGGAEAKERVVPEPHLGPSCTTHTHTHTHTHMAEASWTAAANLIKIYQSNADPF